MKLRKAIIIHFLFIKLYSGNGTFTGLKFKSRSYSTKFNNNLNNNIVTVHFTEKGLLGENTAVSFEPQCLIHINI